MALEAWAHARIEKGEEIDKVLADVIGQSPVPAAYLLVAVDLLLSHWPKSHEAAIPFVGCPELLCIDSQRLIGDSMKVPDLLGLGELQREPAGTVSLESLKSRRSRRLSLDRLLVMYANDEYNADRAVLTDLLQRAIKRLGTPSPASDLGDPEFMVLHALNVSDPKNWRDAIINTQDGPKEVREYVAPAAETEHLRPLQEAIQERNANAQMEAAIRTALNDAAQSSVAFAVTAIKWAQGAGNKPAESETAQSMRDEAIVTAALIAARDGGSDVISEQGKWMRETFARVFKEPHDPVWPENSNLHPLSSIAGLSEQ